MNAHLADEWDAEYYDVIPRLIDALDFLKAKGYEIVKLGVFDEAMYEYWITPVYVREKL